MKEAIAVLIARRSDGKFLQVERGPGTTSYKHIDEPGLATRILPSNKADLKNPKPATFYFEDSWRARELWLKDCVMVAFMAPHAIVEEVEIC